MHTVGIADVIGTGDERAPRAGAPVEQAPAAAGVSYSTRAARRRSALPTIAAAVTLVGLLLGAGAAVLIELL